MTNNVVVIGCHDNLDPNVVANRVSALFNIDGERAKEMILDGHFVAKRNVSTDVATKFQTALEDAGCKVSIEPVERLELDVENESTKQKEEVATNLQSNKDEAIDKEEGKSLTSTSDEVGNVQNKSTNPFASLVGVILFVAVFAFYGRSLAVFYFPVPWKNDLESSLLLLESTRKDFQNFKDLGGLNKTNSWHGFEVSSVNVTFNNENNLLQGFTLTIDPSGVSTGRKGSLIGITKAASKICGDDWIRTSSDGYIKEHSEKMQCGVSQSQTGEYKFYAGIVSD